MLAQATGVGTKGYRKDMPNTSERGNRKRKLRRGKAGFQSDLLWQGQVEGTGYSSFMGRLGGVFKPTYGATARGPEAVDEAEEQ